MQTITINERTKVGEIVGYPDGYYIIKDNPIVLKASGADGETTEIAPDTIIKIEHADSPFHPLVTITNCDDDVTYYINSVLQTGAEFISYNTADKPSSGGGEGGDVISGDLIYKFREPKTDIDFDSESKYRPRVEEVTIKNIGVETGLNMFLAFERVIVDAPLSIPNGGFANFGSNSYNYETRYLYLSDKIVSMEDYAFSSSRISGNIIVDCGFSEDKFPTAMAKAVALGIEVNYNIPKPRSIAARL